MKKNNTGVLLIIYIVMAVVLLIFGISVVKAAVTLLSFEAFPGDQQVILEWETGTETDMLGFYIVRNDQINGNYTRVSNFIFAQGSPVSGLVYQYIDKNLTNGTAYYYKLETVDNTYQSEFFGPLSATPVQSVATQTNTTTNTATITRTNSLTGTPTSTITATGTEQITRTKTSTTTPTSPFSFLTNTSTITATATNWMSPTTTETETPEPSITPEETIEFEIINYNNFTPTRTPTPTPIPESPFQLGLKGFIPAVVVGTLLLAAFFIIQRKSSSP